MRVSTRPALKRLQVIDSAVRREPLPNARTLARELEVTPRTIQRDIEFMRDQLHAPLEFDSVRNGYFRALVRGVCHSRQVSMVYWTASRNETQTRTVDPYDLVLAPDDDWCLIGHCHLRNATRLFKVQRVRSAVETGELFCRPAGFRARDYMAETFGTIRGDGYYHVVLRFTRRSPPCNPWPGS